MRLSIEENVSLAPLTTFKIGGAARYFVAVTELEELGIALDYAQTRQLPFFILAGGSNVLVADEGFNGLVIKIAFNKVHVDDQTGLVVAEAGANLMEVIRKACERGLTGMENMYGIPGSVGGAVRGNAGAFGTEVVDVAKSVTALNINTREERTFTKDECYFGYRQSFFKKSPEWLVLSAVFELAKSDGRECLARAEHVLTMRNERQIQNIQSAGSFFMNPRAPEHIQRIFAQEKGQKARGGRVPSGWLIEKAGLKGVCKGGACSSGRHANYIINDGAATAVSVRALADEMQNAVMQKFGVELHEEVTLVGNV